MPATALNLSLRSLWSDTTHYELNPSRRFSRPYKGQLFETGERQRRWIRILQVLQKLSAAFLVPSVITSDCEPPGKVDLLSALEVIPFILNQFVGCRKLSERQLVGIERSPA